MQAVSQHARNFLQTLTFRINGYGKQIKLHNIYLFRVCFAFQNESEVHGHFDSGVSRDSSQRRVYTSWHDQVLHAQSAHLPSSE